MKRCSSPSCLKQQLTHLENVITLVFSRDTVGVSRGYTEYTLCLIKSWTLLKKNKLYKYKYICIVCQKPTLVLKKRTMKHQTSPHSSWNMHHDIKTVQERDISSVYVDNNFWNILTENLINTNEICVVVNHSNNLNQTKELFNSLDKQFK